MNSIMNLVNELIQGINNGTVTVINCSEPYQSWQLTKGELVLNVSTNCIEITWPGKPSRTIYGEGEMIPLVSYLRTMETYEYESDGSAIQAVINCLRD